MNNSQSFTFSKRLKSMLKVDFRRLFTTPLFYIICGASLVIPILIFVMTSMMDGTVTVDPTNGKETIMEGFKYVWQALGSASSTNAAMKMDLVSMCNINMMFFFIAVIVCLFISDDFRSGYSKNLFTIRSSKVDYIISKTLVGIVCGMAIILFYFVGSLLGGALSGLSFEMVDTTPSGIVMCLLSKMLLVAVFVPIYVCMSVIGKQKVWLSMLISFGVSMLMFMMVPIISPLDSTIINVIFSFVGGLLFSIGLGVVSNKILNKTRLV